MGHITNAAAIAAVDAITALINAGGAGDLVIYGGSVPADADAALGSPTTLATITLETTAFGAAADTTGEATANLALGSGKSATATGGGAGTTATFFRVFSGAGTVIYQGTVGTVSGASDLVLTNTTIATGDTVSITDLEVRLPEATTSYAPS